jgi:hypothetical protein
MPNKCHQKGLEITTMPGKKIRTDSSEREREREKRAIKRAQKAVEMQTCLSRQGNHNSAMSRIPSATEHKQVCPHAFSFDARNTHSLAFCFDIFLSIFHGFEQERAIKQKRRAKNHITVVVCRDRGFKMSNSFEKHACYTNLLIHPGFGKRV